MPTPLELALIRVDEKVPNVGIDELSTAQKTANVLQALKEYSRHVPNKLTVDISGDGSYEYALPAGWVNDFSSILQVEYPAGESQDPGDAIIPPEQYGEYRTAVARVLRFYGITPAAGYTIRITFTAPHAATAATIFANDFDAVCSLASAYCCFDLARRYSQDSESFISADSVDRRTKADKYLGVGKSLVNEFAIHFGLNKETEIAAASGTKNLDLFFPGKIDFITHPSEER